MSDSLLTEVELATITTEIKSLQQIVSKQQIQKGNIETLMKERATWQEHLTTAITRKEELNKACSDLEIQVAKELDAVDHVVKEFNQKAWSAHCLPSTTKRAAGIDYQLTFDTNFPDQLITRLRTTIKVTMTVVAC